MISGEVYNVLDSFLQQDQMRARKFTKEYNSTEKDESEKRIAILK